MIHPWMISTLPRVNFGAVDVGKIAELMSHGATQVSMRDDEPRLHCGSTIWLSAKKDGTPIAIAWDWVEIRSNVVAMVDPMAIISNLECTEYVGGVAVPDYKLLSLNQIVYHLEWQQRVCKAIRAPHVDADDVEVLQPWLGMGQEACSLAA